MKIRSPQLFKIQVENSGSYDKGFIHIVQSLRVTRESYDSKQPPTFTYSNLWTYFMLVPRTKLVCTDSEFVIPRIIPDQGA